MCVSVRCAAMRWLTASCDYCTENSLLPHSAPAVKHNCFFFSFCSQFLTFILCQDSHFLICVPSLYVLSYSFNCYKDLSIIVLRLFRFYFPGDLKKKKCLSLWTPFCLFLACPVPYCFLILAFWYTSTLPHIFPKDFWNLAAGMFSYQPLEHLQAWLMMLIWLTVSFQFSPRCRMGLRPWLCASQSTSFIPIGKNK